MARRRVVVVGGGAAGATAASKAKRVDPSAEVVLVEASPYITHAPCAVPYALMGRMRPYLYTPDQFAAERGIRVYTNTVAEASEGNRIRLRGAHNGVLEWDVLIIATGASPRPLNVEGTNLKGVYTVHHPAGLEAAREGLLSAERVVVVGGGYVGLETAEALLSAGKNVVVIESGRWLLGRMLDGDMARLVTEYFLASGGELRLGETLLRIGGTRRVEYVETSGGRVEADAVVLAVGVKPNVELAAALGARLGETGAVWTDRYLETSVPYVYAAGDVAEAIHAVTKRPVWIPLAPYANKMGYVAGLNAGSGEKKLEFPPVVGASVTKFFDMYIGKAGLNEDEARRAGLDVRSVVVVMRDRAPFMQESRELHVKAVASGDVLVGVEVVARTPYVVAVVDMAAQLVGKPISSAILAEYAYMPHTGPVWHPLISAARMLD
ncbi:MAG: FAD-dependent oxidoreductase [Thermoproteus sp.]